MPRVHPCHGGNSAGQQLVGSVMEKTSPEKEPMERPKSAHVTFKMDSSEPYYQTSFGGPRFGAKEELLTINIGGFIHQTQASTLQRVPKSLLADPKRRQRFYDPASNAYFFDRNRLAFDAILEYYRTGKLIKPTSIPVYIFVREMLFFDLGDGIVDDFLRAQELLDEPLVLPTNKIQRKLYELFNCPETSRLARAIAVFDISMVLTAILSMCILSLPAFQELLAVGDNMTMMHRKKEFKAIAFSNPFFVIDVICTTWFTTDLLVRFLASPNKRHFCFNFMTVVDILSIVPFCVDVLAFLITHDIYNGPAVRFLLAFRIIRLLAIFKVLKMDDYSDGLKVLIDTINTAQKELGIGALFLLVGAVFFATTMYYAERETTNTDYTSIPASLWWAVITWTTIGYGDIFPKTVSGKIVGCICAITGVLALGMIIPPVVRRFEHYFYRAQNMQELHAVFEEHWADDEKRRAELMEIPLCRRNRSNSARDIFAIA